MYALINFIELNLTDSNYFELLQIEACLVVDR